MAFQTIPELVAESEEMFRLRTYRLARRSPTLYWQCEPGLGLIRCVPDARYRKFSPRVRQFYSPVLMVVDKRVEAENDALRNAVEFAAEMFWTITSGDGSGHADLARALFRIAGDASVGDAELRKDAERYRWFRNHSLQIVHASTGPWAHDLDKVIDEAMAEADAFDVPLLCRRRMAAEGLPYPRSSCYSCGKFSPKSRDCDALIAARLKEGK